MASAENKHTNPYKAFLWERIRPSKFSIKTKIGITLGSVLLYLLVFPLVKNGSAIVFMVIINGWIWGVEGGLIAGLLAMPIAFLAFHLAGLIFPNPNPGATAITLAIVGVSIGWLGTLLEQIYQQSQELAVARDQALEATRLKTMMLSTVSHELRTPLGAILGYAELLAEGIYGTVTDEQRNKLGYIVSSVHDLEALVNDLMDMSRIEFGHIQLFAEPFSVPDMMENVLTKTAVQADKKSLQMIWTVYPDMPQTIIGDQMRVGQILTNLVTNAIKYTSEGSIQVEVYPKPNKQWMMRVTDTGIGITPEAQKYIFDAFRQAQYITSHARSGLGLGLSIVDELVHLMNGSITLDSTVGKGSCFTVTLPLVFSETGKPSCENQ